MSSLKDVPHDATEFDRQMSETCRTGNLARLKVLLQARPGGIHRFQQDLHTGTFLHPLHLAAIHNQIDLLRHFCNLAAIDPNIRNDVGQTPLILAAKHNNLAAIRCLCECPGVDINARDNLGQSALQLVVKHNHEESVNYLCRRPGIKLNIRDKNGQTLLMLAIRSNCSVGIEYLCSQPGTNINAWDKSGKSAILLSIQRNNAVVTRLLLEKGAQINGAFEGLYNTPLYAAIAGDRKLGDHSFSCDGELLRLLLSYGAKPNQKIDYYDNIRPLHIAAHFGLIKCIDVLVEYGAHLRHRSYRGATPMHLAALAQNEAAMIRLLHLGATINEPRATISDQFWPPRVVKKTLIRASTVLDFSRYDITLLGEFRGKQREKFYSRGGQPLDFYLGSRAAMNALERERVEQYGDKAYASTPTCIDCQIL